MSTFIERLVVERDELREKHVKLGAFLFEDKFFELDNAQQALLQMQHVIMAAYIQCLNERLLLLESQIGFE